jgi:acetyltransferase EpsM
MSKVRKVAIIGGTGNGLVTAQVIVDMAKAGQPVEMVGFLNDHQAVGSSIGGYPVLGRPCDWKALDEEISLVFALLSVGKMRERAELLETFEIPDSKMTTLVHPTALLGAGVTVGSGSVIASYVTCQPGSRVGKNSIVRAGANLGHDAIVGDFVDIGPNVTLCGYASVFKGAHIAPNAVVKDRTIVNEFSVLGAGSVALRDMEPGSLWMGNPGRRVR